MSLFGSVLGSHLNDVVLYYSKRADFINKNNRVMQGAPTYDPVVQKGIDDQHSVNLKNAGNEAFKEGDYHKARLLYTQSVAAAKDGGISSGGLDCAFAYANR
jgi:hypothetical protein